ncbi:MAG: hypothetical protein ABIZ80_01555, partial [Bryobacteraceae bacterium]
AFTAYSSKFEPDGEDMSVSSKPNALVLYNPAMGRNTAKEQTKEEQERSENFLTSWKVTKGGAPAILFFGAGDPLLKPARTFVREMAAAGNRVEMYTAEGQAHGFFNDRPAQPWHAVCLRETDSFLASLGYLKGTPTVKTGAGVSLKKAVR